MNSDAVVAYQAERKRKTIDAIELAKTTIEQELAQYGYYPLNSGRLSKLEVLRRAGVSAQTLKNPTHKETASSLDRWMRRIRKSAPTLTPEAEDVKGSRIRDLESRLDKVTTHYDLFKLEYNDLLHRCEELEVENSSLRKQINDGLGGKLVPFKGKRKQ